MNELLEFLRRLMQPLEIGSELLPGVRFLRVSAELGLRITFRVDPDHAALGDLEPASRSDESAQSVDIHVEVFPAEPPQPHASASARLLFAYRASGTHPGAAALRTRRGGKAFSSFAKAVCETVALRARTTEASALERLELATDQRRLREVRVDQLLEPSEDRRFYTLSPYVGCVVGCRFCYAAERTSIARTMLGLKPAPWGSYVDVRVNAAEVLERELRDGADADERARAPIKFCPIVSDPYQAVESKYRITRQCLEVLARAHRGPVFILSRSPLIEDDLALIASLPNPWVGVSLPTLDDDARAHFEPRAATIPERLRILRRFREAGVRTFAVAQPMLPGDAGALARALHGVVDSVSIDVLQGEYGASADFDDPRFVHARERDWQIAQAQALASALSGLGISLWRGELPASLQ